MSISWQRVYQGSLGGLSKLNDNRAKIGARRWLVGKSSWLVRAEWWLRWIESMTHLLYSSFITITSICNQLPLPIYYHLVQYIYSYTHLIQHTLFIWHSIQSNLVWSFDSLQWLPLQRVHLLWLSKYIVTSTL